MDRTRGPVGGSAEFRRYAANGETRDFAAQRGKHAQRAAYLLRAVRRHDALTGRDVLEAGCAEGLLLSLLPPGNRLAGFDANAERLGAALAPGAADLSVRDVYATGFEDGRFDVVFCSEVIEHLERPADALAELARVCRAGGLVCFSVPYDEAIRHETCVHCGKPTPRGGHLHRFDETTARAIIPDALAVLSVERVCNNAVLMRFHRAPGPVYRALDALATRVLRVSKPRWMVVLCRRER